MGTQTFAGPVWIPGPALSISFGDDFFLNHSKMVWSALPLHTTSYVDMHGAMATGWQVSVLRDKWGAAVSGDPGMAPISAQCGNFGLRILTR